MERANIQNKHNEGTEKLKFTFSSNLEKLANSRGVKANKELGIFLSISEERALEKLSQYYWRHKNHLKSRVKNQWTTEKFKGAFIMVINKKINILKIGALAIRPV